MTSRDLTFLLYVWFFHQHLFPAVQTQPDDASPANRNHITSNRQNSQNYKVSHPSGKAVLSEEQNQHCFREDIYGSGEAHGHLHTRYCYPGYRRSSKNETCSGPHGCCPCDKGTYMPNPNDCSHCIMKTFCHDFGLEYVDFGSSTNNSECGAQIQEEQNDQPIPYTTSEDLTTITTNTTTAVIATNKIMEHEQARISGLEIWIKEHVAAIALYAAVMSAGVLLVVPIGLIFLVYFCAVRLKKNKRKLDSSSFGMRTTYHKPGNCFSEANKLTLDTDEDEACEVALQPV